jgi:hypothetical protein
MTYPLISQKRVWKPFAFPMKGYQYPWPQTVCGTLMYCGSDSFSKSKTGWNITCDCHMNYQPMKHTSLQTACPKFAIFRRKCSSFQHLPLISVDNIGIFLLFLFQPIRWVRSLPCLAGHKRAIPVTSLSMKQHRATYFSGSFHHRYVKPLERHFLYAYSICMIRSSKSNSKVSVFSPGLANCDNTLVDLSHGWQCIGNQPLEH